MNWLEGLLSDGRPFLTGENFTVEGLRLEVGGQVVAVLASATCGGPAAAEPVVQQAPAKPNKTKQAPKPTPVKTSAPVTG